MDKARRWLAATLDWDYPVGSKGLNSATPLIK